MSRLVSNSIARQKMQEFMKQEHIEKIMAREHCGREEAEGIYRREMDTLPRYMDEMRRRGLKTK